MEANYHREKEKSWEKTIKIVKELKITETNVHNYDIVITNIELVTPDSDFGECYFL